MGIGKDFEDEKNKQIDEAEMPSIVKRQLKDETRNNPQAIIEGKDRATRDRAAGKDPGVKDQFLESISFFLPSIVGGLVGSAIGGTEGAGKGAELGLRAGAQLSQKQAQDADRALREKLEKDDKIFRSRQTKLAQEAKRAELEEKQAFDVEEREDIQKFKAEEAEKDRRFTAGITAKKLATKGEKPLTESQSKSRLFGARAAQAEEVFKGLEFDPTATRQRAQSVLPRELQSKEYQQHEQAKQNFLNAILRKESGARISEEEISIGDKQYFPQPGDRKEVVAQKKANRELATKLLLEEGRVDITDPKFKGLVKREQPKAQPKKPGRSLMSNSQRKRLEELKKKYRR